jgi:hypothetical protein
MHIHLFNIYRCVTYLDFPELSNQSYTKSSAQILMTVYRCLSNYTVYNRYIVSNDIIVTFELKRV